MRGLCRGGCARSCAPDVDTEELVRLTDKLKREKQVHERAAELLERLEDGDSDVHSHGWGRDCAVMGGAMFGVGDYPETREPMKAMLKAIVDSYCGRVKVIEEEMIRVMRGEKGCEDEKPDTPEDEESPDDDEFGEDEEAEESEE